MTPSEARKQLQMIVDCKPVLGTHAFGVLQHAIRVALEAWAQAEAEVKRLTSQVVEMTAIKVCESDRADQAEAKLTEQLGRIDRLHDERAAEARGRDAEAALRAQAEASIKELEQRADQAEASNRALIEALSQIAEDERSRRSDMGFVGTSYVGQRIEAALSQAKQKMQGG